MAKIVLKALDERLKSEVEETRFGFRKGSGTRNATFRLRTVMEKAVEKQREVYVWSYLFYS